MPLLLFNVYLIYFMDSDNLLDRIKEMQNELADLKKVILSQGKMVYSHAEAAALFSVSKKTLSSWRDKGMLGFSQAGSTYLYSEQDIKDFLERYHRLAWYGESKRDVVKKSV